MELKYGSSADAAIQQIRDKRYAQAFAGYTGKVILVGLNYDRESKKHNCKIETEELK